MKKVFVSDEKLMQLVEHSIRSVEDFYKFVEFFGGSDSLEIAQYYILHEEHLDSFMDNHFSGNLDRIYRDLSLFAIELEQKAVNL